MITIECLTGHPEVFGVLFAIISSECDIYLIVNLMISCIIQISIQLLLRVWGFDLASLVFHIYNFGLSLLTFGLITID